MVGPAQALVLLLWVVRLVQRSSLLEMLAATASGTGRDLAHCPLLGLHLEISLSQASLVSPASLRIPHEHYQQAKEDLP